jgi:hypothetical protein
MKSDLPHYYVVDKDGIRFEEVFIDYMDAYAFIDKNLLIGARVEKSYEYHKKEKV